MDCTIEIEIPVKYKTKNGKTKDYTISKEVDSCCYLDRVEECYGYHPMYEVPDKAYEEAIDNFIDNCDEQEILDEINENEESLWEDDDEAVEIIWENA